MRCDCGVVDGRSVHEQAAPISMYGNTWPSPLMQACTRIFNVSREKPFNYRETSRMNRTLDVLRAGCGEPDATALSSMGDRP